MRPRSRRAVITGMLLPLLIGGSALFRLPAALAQEPVAKEVTLIINGRRLIASNVRLSRFDEERLSAKETIVEKTEAKGVIVVATNQRVLAYGVSSGWRDMKTLAGEEVISVRAEDFAAFVVTNKRYLNFNGNTGVWAEQDKRVER